MYKIYKRLPYYVAIVAACIAIIALALLLSKTPAKELKGSETEGYKENINKLNEIDSELGDSVDAYIKSLEKQIEIEKILLDK